MSTPSRMAQKYIGTVERLICRQMMRFQLKAFKNEDLLGRWDGNVSVEITCIESGFKVLVEGCAPLGGGVDGSDVEGIARVPLGQLWHWSDDADVVAAVSAGNFALRWGHAEHDAREFLEQWDANLIPWREVCFGRFDDDYGWLLDRCEEDFVQLSPAIRRCYNIIKPILERKNHEAGYVYCLHDGQGNYKIGRTKSLSSRIRQLSAQPPFPVQMIWAFPVLDAPSYETQLHRLYAQYRVRGGCEWFRFEEHAAHLIAYECQPFFDINGEEIEEESHINFETYIQAANAAYTAMEGADSSL